MGACLVLALVSVLAGSVQQAGAVSTSVVISQVYGGGGNVGAPWANDYVELFNRSSGVVDLTGWSIQYTSATGTGSFGANTGQLTPLSGMLAPHQYALVEEASGGANGVALPSPRITDATPINMSATGGKVALVNTTTSLGCNGGSTPCTEAGRATVVDLIGYDGANFFEGVGPAPSLSNTTAAFRAVGGCADTDNNAADFGAAPPNPRTSLSPENLCSPGPTGTGGATPAAVPVGGAVTLHVTVTPATDPSSTGLAVTVDLREIGGSFAQPFFDDGTNGDPTPNDHVFTLSVASVSASPGPGISVKKLRATISDAEGRFGTTSIFLGVTAPTDPAPAVATRSPANGATDVPLNGNVTIGFSEPVNVIGEWFSISCTSSGAHTAAVTGGPQSFTLDPETDFVGAETCTVTVLAANVTDQDATDPPDTLAANDVWSFTTAAPVVRIHDIQGAGHISPYRGQAVAGVEGIVTWERSSSFYMQDPTPDADEATSEGILVFGSGVGALVNVGDRVRVGGGVVEFRPGGSGGLANLTTTEITSPALSVSVLSSGNPLPAPTVLGAGGRIAPSEVIEDDAAGNVEDSGTFDPAQDGVDFYESVEGMRVQVDNAVAVGPTNGFGEIPVVGDNSAHAGIDSVRGGVVIRQGDFNPERIQLDDTFLPTPVVNVGDGFTTPVIGVMDYSFGNFKLDVTTPLTRVDNGLQREVTRAPIDQEIVVGTYNVENLDPGDGAAFAGHADLIVNHLRSPDLLARRTTRSPMHRRPGTR